MVHNIDAIYDGGVFRPIDPLSLPEGARVHLRVEEETKLVEQTESSPSDGQIPTLLERMKGFVGTVHDLPEDASVNLDHYLYGMPKRE
jgi:predicted DNA-binding antitoxin AbrB/MazE fold protein